jgi:BMFP domain-containing protein YqiC
MREAMGGVDFVSREEFDAVKDMAALAREKVELLEAKISALEARLADK